MRGYTMNRDDYVIRLRRIEGQVRGLQRMIETDEYCIDVLTQLSSTTAALQSVAIGLVDEHLRNCLIQAAAQGSDEERDAKLSEAIQAVSRLVRS
jgi:CsoR family transcriptional regulator, copper-sensing transcriptional repressor